MEQSINTNNNNNNNLALMIFCSASVDAATQMDISMESMWLIVGY